MSLCYDFSNDSGLGLDHLSGSLETQKDDPNLPLEVL